MEQGSVKLILDADPSKQAAAIDLVNKKQVEHRSEIVKTSDAAKKQAEAIKTAAEKANMTVGEYITTQNRAGRVVAMHRTELEKLEKQERDLKAALDAGSISQEDFDRTMKRIRQSAHELTDEFKSQQREIREGVAASKKLTQATMTLEQKTDALKRSLKSAYDAGEIGAKEYQTAVRNAGKATDNTLQSTGRRLAENVTGWVSIASVARAAALAADLYREQAERGAAALRQSEVGLRDLASISENQVELVERTSQARKIQTSAGIDIDKAAEMVFKLDSASLIGADQDTAKNNEVVKYFAGLTDITDASSMIGLAAQSKASFGIDYAQSVNLGMKAAEASPEMTPAELSKQIAEASRGTSLFHAKDQLKQAVETASLTSILSITAGTSSGNIVKGGAMKLSEAYAGDTVFDAARKAAALSPEDYKSQFGDNENVKLLLDVVRTKEAEISAFNHTLNAAASSAGTKGSIVNTKRRMLEQNPDFALLKHGRVAEQKANDAALESGRIRFASDAAYTRAQAEVASGHGYWQETFSPISLGFDAGRRVGASADRVGNYISFGVANTFGLRGTTASASPEYEAALRELAEKEQQEAERRHQELLKSLQRPLITRPGDDR